MNPFPLQNISDLPSSIGPQIKEFTDKILNAFGDNVRAVLVYGSAAGINYVPGVSNINIAVVLKQLDFALLTHSQQLVKWGHKHKFATPLILTKEYILNSLDVFPVEYSEIKEQHKLIFGEDIFKDLEIPLKDVRLLCEQQVKGKYLHLRQAYLEAGENPAVITNLLLSALNDLVPVFRQLIVLKGQMPQEAREEMLGQLAKIYALDQETLLAIYNHKFKKNLIPSHQAQAHLQNYLGSLESLSRHLDSL